MSITIRSKTPLCHGLAGVGSFIGIIFCSFFLVSGCFTSPIKTVENKIKKEIIHAQHIVFIGLDGFGSAYIPKANMPTVKQMIAEGSSNINMRNILPSISWPNWSSLFRGTPPQNQTVTNFPSIFTLIKHSNTIEQTDNGISSFFYQWEELDKICSSDEAEKFVIESSYESLSKIATYIIENKPILTVIVFEEPDTTGHKKAWGSKAYYNKLQILDDFIAIIIQAVKEAGIYSNTVFMLSSDHGGYFYSHWLSVSRNRKIPFIVFGRGIKKGYIVSSSTAICDIAPTMALSLGLEIPPEWTGTALTEIFE
jgi:predicted AlkP superfamily pyrophosphatase or phosphodiesterase